MLMCSNSSEGVAGAQGADIITIEEELCSGERRAISRFADSVAGPKSHGIGRGRLAETVDAIARRGSYLLTCISATRLQVT